MELVRVGLGRLCLCFLLGLALVLAHGGAQLRAQGVFIRGDCEQSDRLDISDAITILSFLFLGTDEPICLDACDTDDSGAIDITDSIFELSFLFLGGSPPPAPFPLEDPDPTDDDLGCLNGRVLAGRLETVPRELFFHRLEQSAVLSVFEVREGGERVDLSSDPTVRYSSDDESIAEVDSSGRVLARGVGSTRLRARYRGVDAVSFVHVLPGADGSPAVTFTAPGNGTIVVSSEVVASGIVSDPSAVLTLQVAGAPDQAVDNTSGRFSVPVPLALGENLLTVLAEGKGGTGKASVTVRRAGAGEPGPDGLPLPGVPAPRVDPPDTTPPEVAITSPTPGAVLRSGVVDVRGTVDDPAAEVRVNGVLARVEGTEFLVDGLRLPPGMARIALVARDQVGNEGRAEVTVRIDAIWPRITVVEPSGDQVLLVGSTTFTVSGEVEPAGCPVTVNAVRAQVTGTTYTAELTLAEGLHDLEITATWGTEPARRSRLVRRLLVDGQGPVVEMLYPPAPELLSLGGFPVDVPEVRIVGRVFDPGVPLDLAEEIALGLDGADRVFTRPGSFALDVVLEAGTNVLELTAEDARGNVTSTTLRLVRGAVPGPRLDLVSGNGQNVRVGEPLAASLTVRALDGAGNPQPGVPVTFRVEAGSGTLTGGRRTLEVGTDGVGLASVELTAGLEAGSGSQLVTASVPGYTGSPLGFVAGTTPGADRILTTHGRRELVGTAAAACGPLSVRLFDRAGNSIAGAEVRFRVVTGGALLDGNAEVTRRTSPGGVAEVEAQLPDVDSSTIVEATSAGAAPVRFELVGLEAGAAPTTDVEGVILDDRSQAVANAEILVGGDGGSATTTGRGGGFLLQGIPAGEVVLEVRGGPGYSGAGRKIFAVAGRRNSVPGPLRVARVEGRDRSHRLRVDAQSGALFTLPSLPGFRLEVPPGAARFDGGSQVGDLQVVFPNRRALPDPAPDGVNLLLPLVIEPRDVRFVTAAKLVLPNPATPGSRTQGGRVDWGAGRRLSLYGQTASAGGFVELARAEVGADATTITTAPELGVLSGGVHFFSVPGPYGGRQGLLVGQVDYRLPYLNEAPQRPRSHVVGRNVYAHSGELFLDEIDLEIPGRGLAYRFRRRYESRHNFRGSLGWNWEHEYADRRLLRSLRGGNVVRADGRGNFDEYLHDAESNEFISAVGVFARLFRTTDGFLVERLPDGTRYRYHPLDGSTTAGLLDSITARHGDRLEMVRASDGRLMEVRDNLQRSVAYFYDDAGRIESIRDFAGRTVRFEYSGDGDLEAVTGPAVVGTITLNDFPEGKRTEYVYSAGFSDARLNHNLLQVISPREVSSGTRRPWLVNQYRDDPSAPDVDRVVAQEWGGTNASGVSAGGSLSIEYVDLSASDGTSPMGLLELESRLLAEAGLTRYRDRAGHLTEVTWSGAGLPLKVRVHTEVGSRPRDPYSLHPPPGISPPWYETRYRWNREGLLVEIHRPRGNWVEYTYDTEAPLRCQRANVIREARHPPAGVEADPEVVERRYDPLFARCVLEIPARAQGEETRYAKLWQVDYQETADLGVLAREAGVSEDDLAAAVEWAGMDLGQGDLNGDEILGPARGDVVREVLPTVTLPDGTERQAERLYVYNGFGQLVSRRDAVGTVTLREYYPETDPEGDGEPRGEESLDPETGGYLRRVVVDAESVDGREPLRITTSYLYDQLGNVVRVTDPNGNETLLRYNALRQLTEYRLPNPLRYRRRYFYDADDNLTGVNVENFRATDGNFILPVVENQWIETTIDHDILRQPVRVRREVSGGEVGPARFVKLELRYDPEGRLARVIRPVADTDETWSYDERGLVLTHTRGEGTAQAATRAWWRDENGNVVLEEDAEDSDGDQEREVTEYRYDAWDRLVATVDAAGGARVMEREPGGLVVLESILGTAGGPTPRDRSGRGNVLLSRTAYEHDERGRLRETRRWLFSPAAGLYSLPGESTEPRALAEKVFRDGEGRIVRRLKRGGREETYLRDAAGRVVEEETGTEGGSVYERRSRIYDANDNVLKETRAWLSTEVIDENGAGDPDYSDDGRLRVVRDVVHLYDQLDRRVVTVDSAGHTWRARYDSADNLIFVSDGKGPVVGAEVDPEIAPALSLLNVRQRENVNTHGNRVRYVYDNVGRLVAAVHEMRRDGEGGGILEDTNPYNLDGMITEEYEWDDNDRLVAWTNDLGRRTELEYDAAGFIVRQQLPDGGAVNYARDRDGNPRLREQGGLLLRQRFDALHRLVERSVDVAPEDEFDGTTRQVFEYDGLSRVTLATDNNEASDPGDDSLVLRHYDSVGRLVEEWQNGFGFHWGYDDTGRVVAQRYPDGNLLVTPRDAAGGMALLGDGAAVYATYSRLASGALLHKELPGGVRLSFLEEDENGIPRLVGYDVQGNVVRHAYTGGDGGPLIGFEYGREANGLPLYERQLHRDGKGDVWRYDSVYRLRLFVPDVFDPRVPPVDPVRKLAFFTDGNHNWRLVLVDQSRRFLEVNERSQYVVVDVEALEYDARGNLARAGELEFVYDALNRLAQVTRGGEVVARYGYDALGAEDPQEYAGRGRRIQKNVERPVSGQPAGVLRFTYVGDVLAEERSAAGDLERQYFYEESGSEAGALQPAVLLAREKGGTARSLLFLHNTLGSTVALATSEGLLEETARYGLEGEVTIHNRVGFQVRYSRVGNALYFGGLPWDPEVELHSVGGRRFDPRLGRFLSEQRPLVPRAPLGLNAYQIPGLRPLPGEIAGGGSSVRRRDELKAYRVRLPVDAGGHWERPEAGGRRAEAGRRSAERTTPEVTLFGDEFLSERVIR